MFAHGRLDELIRLAMRKSTKVAGDCIICHTKVPKNLVRDSLKRRRLMRSFDTPLKTVGVASSHRCYPWRLSNTLSNSGWIVGLRLFPDQEHLVRHGAGQNNVCLW
jgi:hypothetical protein